MLYDKGYYDYDYEAVKEKQEIDRSVLSQSQLNAILGVKPKQLIPEQLQSEVLEEERKKLDNKYS